MWRSFPCGVVGHRLGGRAIRDHNYGGELRQILANRCSGRSVRGWSVVAGTIMIERDHHAVDTYSGGTRGACALKTLISVPVVARWLMILSRVRTSRPGDSFGIPIGTDVVMAKALLEHLQNGTTAVLAARYLSSEGARTSVI
jgi:hypothetical protein